MTVPNMLSPEDIIEHLEIMSETVEPIPYSIANSDLNLDNPDECLMIDGYRADYFQTYIMSAVNYLKQFIELTEPK